jgi:hypothetical protein
MIVETFFYMENNGAIATKSFHDKNISPIMARALSPITVL